MYETKLAEGVISIGDLLRREPGTYSAYFIKGRENINRFQRQAHSSAAKINAKVECRSLYGVSPEGDVDYLVKVTILTSAGENYD